MLLSACLLSYNSAITLESAIKSVLEQDFTDYELIISDDCSTDKSWEVIQEYSKLYCNVHAIRTPQNYGVAGNANFAVAQAKGKYVAILHHDDEYRFDLFRKWINLMEENINVGLCFNDYSHKERNINSTHSLYFKKSFNQIIKGKYFLKHHLLKKWGCPVWGSYITRKFIWDELNGFNPNFGILPDIAMTMSIAARWDIGYINEPLMDLKRGKPEEYPKEYTEFSWGRLFNLFDIHSININRNNFPNFIQYLFKRFVFRNKVSFEIIKWHFYAIYKKRKDILELYPAKNKNELFYSIMICRFIRSFYK